MSPFLLHLLFIFIVHSIPVIIVQPFKRCKIVLEFVPASYAINRLYNCLCGNSVSHQLVDASDTSTHFLPPHQTALKMLHPDAVFTGLMSFFILFLAASFAKEPASGHQSQVSSMMCSLLKFNC